MLPVTMAVQDFPLTSLQSVILTTGPFVFLWSYFKRYVEKYGALKWVESLYDIHDFVLAGTSLVLAAHVLDIGHHVLVLRTGYEVDPHTLGYCYHVLKIYEYLDIILSVLSGNTIISKYSAFSHLALPYWSYYRVIDNDALDWRFQVIADCLVRFLTRAVPWLVPDVRTEEIVLSMAEDWRWYPDLVISAFWATFMFQGTREDKMAVGLFGAPHDDETTARLLSLAILLYGGHQKRREDAEKAKAAKPDDDKAKTTAGQPSDQEPEGVSSGNDAANAIRLPQKPRRKR